MTRAWRPTAPAWQDPRAPWYAFAGRARRNAAGPHGGAVPRASEVEAPGLDAYPLHPRERESDERNTLRTVLDRGPPTWSDRGLTPTPARSVAGRPAGGSRPLGARGRGPAGGGPRAGVLCGPPGGRARGPDGTAGPPRPAGSDCQHAHEPPPLLYAGPRSRAGQPRYRYLARTADAGEPV